jgi:hypothetical protein
MHQLPSQQISIDLNAFEVARIDQPSYYPSPLYIPPSDEPDVICTRIVDYSIFSAPWAKELEAISGRSILDEIEPDFATLFALRAQALNFTGQKISDVMSTALGALAEQGFRAKEVSYLCNDVDMDIALGIEFGVDCTFDQFVDITRYMRTAIRNKHENPLTDLVLFAASPLEEGDNPNDQP